jgi:colanic acid/amylovoran biosynthesis glycosyltransferase
MGRMQHCPCVPSVLYVLKRFPRLSQTFVLNELLELERQGADVGVLARAGADEAISHAAVATLRARVEYLPAPGGDAQLVDVVRRRRPGHLHAHFATWGARAAHLASASTGVPYSFTAHARDIYGDHVDRAALVERIAQARFVVTVTEFNRRHLAALMDDAGVPGRVVRIYNGVDLDALAPRGVERDRDLVVGVGRLVEKKGFDALVEAIDTVRASRPAVRCVIVGEGPDRAALEAQIAARGLEDHVSLAGAMRHVEIATLVERAAVFALPCNVAADGDVDALPTVILEAMALGTPVVSTAISGIPEMVEHEHTGLLVGERDTRALAAALTRLLEDAGECARLAAAARALARERFDLRRNVAALHSLFADATVAA